MFVLLQALAVPILPQPTEGMDMTCMAAAEGTLSRQNREGKNTSFCKHFGEEGGISLLSDSMKKNVNKAPVLF